MSNDRSFATTGAAVQEGPTGQLAHHDHIAHGAIIERRFETVRPGVWCLVGNGLSNQTFVEGPDGIVAIDTGESVQEMAEALRELRAVTDRPVAAVIYTHFHYVSGTTAVFDEAGHAVPVYGHERIVLNKARVGGEIAPAYSRGLVQQFGIGLPADGPDGIVNVGLGLAYRNAAHAPFTVGFVPPTITFDTATTLTIAGLRVEVTPAPSDADDSVTLWFPELGVCVNNLVWPVLFNVFAIRGEEYRDPRVLLDGLDHLLSLGAEHLVGAHGPSISGADAIRSRVTRYRDAIQFLWDQTVRGINKGWTTDELAERVVLPAACDDDYLTSERYGVTEHHVRQIHDGLRGWFDGDPAKLFPLPRADRAQRLIAGFGGYDTVAAQARAALDGDDVRWACELASWLVAAPGATTGDRGLLAAVLRAIGQRTPAANIRNWCISAARDLDGTSSLDRHRTHRLRRNDVMADPLTAMSTLRVLIDPQRADGLDHHVRFVFDGDAIGGLHVRNSVAVPTDGARANSSVHIRNASWADVLTGARPWADVVASGDAVIDGDAGAVARVMGSFEIVGATR